jgi:hypothetical protein
MRGKTAFLSCKRYNFTKIQGCKPKIVGKSKKTNEVA